MIKITDRLTSLLLILLSIFLVIFITLSIPWRYEHDTPIMLYIAFMMDKLGSIPYRDIFDFNMPGVYLIYLLIVKVFGYSDLGIRLADLFFLGGILLTTWLMMSSIDKRSAWFGVVYWGITYLGFGPSISLQREQLALLPITAGLYFAFRRTEKSRLDKIIIGFLFGITAMIKPHLAIGLPALLLMDFPEESTKDLAARLRIFFRQEIIYASIGFLIPCMGMFFYLWVLGSLPSFAAMATNYWPLYTQITGDFRILSGFQRAEYIYGYLREYGNYGIWLAPALLGYYVFADSPALDAHQKHRIQLLAWMALLYGLYPLFASQFWSYHWLPFGFFIIQLSALCLLKLKNYPIQNRFIFPILALILAIFQTLPVDRHFIDMVKGIPLDPPKDGRVDKIASYLKSNLHEGDTVQPLDWSSGVLHAMLIAKAKIATPYIYDFYFYHHISNPYIQHLRNDFMSKLQKAKPQIVIQVIGDYKPWVTGTDTTREFKELQAFLDADYFIDAQGAGYFIYRLK